MIIEYFIELSFWFIDLIFSGFSLVGVPVSAISVFYNLIDLGVWIVGAECFGALMSSVIFWMGFKLSAGFILFLWRLLPLT